MSSNRTSRLLKLNDKPFVQSGNSVIYVMSRDQRVQDNFALLTAQELAIKNNKSLLVIFNLLSSSPPRSYEHFEFMLTGLKEVESNLIKLNIPFIININQETRPSTKLTELNPCQVIFDFNPLRGPRNLQKNIAHKLNCAVSVCDTHNIIPTWKLSDKEEFAAHTIRRKVHKLLPNYLTEPPKITKHPVKLNKNYPKINYDKIEKIISKIGKSNIQINFLSGESHAHTELSKFIDNKLSDYANSRNDPSLDAQSNLSPYLHYGQISSLRITLELLKLSDLEKSAPLLIREAKLASPPEKPTVLDNVDVYLEELIVRKELSDNYCFYNKNYDSLKGARNWAIKTLTEHETDTRKIYSLNYLEAANTHDEIWNASQKQLTKHGKIHGYMRMYWAKKILEWSENANQAIKTANFLNDHYSIDGKDPNGYTGIMWSIAGVHDRPWFNRDIYGKIRYMNDNGLRKKFDVDKYINSI